MAAFASAGDLALFTGDDSLEGVRGYQLVEMASSVIRNYCRQTFDLVEDDEVELRGTWSPKLKLPERPVVSVTSVMVDDKPVTGWRLVRDTLHRNPSVGSESFELGWSARSWGDPSYTVTVVYTHGFAAGSPGLATLETVCLQVAARAAGNPQSFTRLSTAEGTQVGWQPTGGPFGLTSSETVILDRFRHEYAS